MIDGTILNKYKIKFQIRDSLNGVRQGMIYRVLMRGEYSLKGISLYK